VFGWDAGAAQICGASLVCVCGFFVYLRDVGSVVTATPRAVSILPHH
jgi:hypothetical protein